MEDRNISIKAIMDKDLRGILVQTGQYEDFVSGNIMCANCGRVINEDNVSTLLPYEEDGVIKLKFYCNSIECVNCEK